MDTDTTLKTVPAFLQRKLSATLVTVTAFIILISLIVGLFWYTITQALGNYLAQQTEVLGNSLATQAAFNATQSILTNDLLSLNVLLNRLVVDENILSARVYNKKDELLAEADSGSSPPNPDDMRPNDKRRVYSSSIKFRDEIVGHVLITLDKTPAQATIRHLSNLLIGVAIFSSTIAALLILLITKWLFSPINETTEALIALGKGHHDAPLPSAKYKEISQLRNAVQKVQSLEWPKDNPPLSDEPLIHTKTPEKVQYEIDFEKIFEESKQRTCVLFFDIINMDDWHRQMTPLEVANLLTPIYRAIFQASEAYLGHVYQYRNDSVLVFFSARDSDKNLYLNAISTAQLFLGLMNQLLEHDLYEKAPKLNFHLGLHQGDRHITEMVNSDSLQTENLGNITQKIQQLRQSQSINKLVISDDIFTLSDIQNRVFTSLPEVIEHEGEEIMAYEVKGMSDKYQLQILEHINEIGQLSNDREKV